MAPTDRVWVDVGDVDAVVDLMATVGDAGWLNLTPQISDEIKIPSTPTAFAVFSKRGPVVPLATWTPARRHRRAEPAAVGVQHGLGSSARERLSTTPAALPEGWRVVADHPRRGLVALLPEDTAPPMVAAWLLGAVDVLCRLPHTGRIEVRRYPPAR